MSTRIKKLVVRCYLFVSEHDLPGGWPDIDGCVHFVDVSAMVVREGVLQSPRRPVLNVEQAPHAVVFQTVVLQVLKARPVQRKPVVNHSAVRESGTKRKEINRFELLISSCKVKIIAYLNC